MKKYLFFDLDGTLTDSCPGITNCVRHALSCMNVPVGNEATLLKFIGPPLKDSFIDYYGMTPEDADRAVAFFRTRYNETGCFENEVYTGIPEMLKALKDAGYKLIVATSKPEHMAKKILQHFSLAAYFDLICGATVDDTRTRKDEIIDYAIDSFGITDKSEIIMIGDREHDVNGAHKCGLECIGVLWGYGSQAEFDACGAEYTVADPDALISLVSEL